jgi:SAM-dependent methyltransferase
MFARENGWRPSDKIDVYPGTEDIANGHILVEHGLANAAVLSFLKDTHPFASLGRSEQLRLLSLSYNNLVDWHLFPDPLGLTAVYNRTQPPSPLRLSIDEYPEVWRAASFDMVSGRRPNPNLPSLDDALVRTLSDWKRRLPTEAGAGVDNSNISALFNGILFVRAAEDHNRALAPNAGQILLDVWTQGRRKPATIRSCLKACLKSLGITNTGGFKIDYDALSVFDTLTRETIQALLSDFYQNRFAPYSYDFSLISKHALSRIYEHYVSLLRDRDSPQMMLFAADLPDEVSNRAVGGVYTPQFVARFFARYLKENHTPPSFRRMRTCDPSCGSGIFLRTMLEMQCDPWQEVDMSTPTTQAFANVLGLDVDRNACNATRLSLALLHLVLTGSPPPVLAIEHSEAIEHLQNHKSLHGSFDAVIANPPFIKWDNLTLALRQRVKQFMGDTASGKVDMFLAILKAGLELVKPGGHLLYVLPHSFLLSESARGLRREISRSFCVRFLADLSEIPVFEETGAYVVLLVLQRREPKWSRRCKSRALAGRRKSKAPQDIDPKHRLGRPMIRGVRGVHGHGEVDGDSSRCPR